MISKSVMGAAMVLLAAPAVAAIVPVASYDMLNGTSGTFRYWDASYNGTGATTTDGAALSGGTGDLTDGIIASASWYLVENGAGTGPWVGWNGELVSNPVLTFYFAGNPTITSLSLHIDNVGFGNVSAPAEILINGVSTAFTAPTPGTTGWINITGLNLVGGSHTVQIKQSNQWAFVSEVTFGSSVPEPGSWATMIAGFGLVGATMRRRRLVAN